MCVLWLFIFVASTFSPVQKMEEERLAHEQKLAKMEAEMRSVFQAKVQEKEAKLKQSEEEVKKKKKKKKKKKLICT
jgi:septin 7